jgi:hypothetical protein
MTTEKPTAKSASGGLVTLEMSLVAKLAIIMGELGAVPKEGFNKAQQYRFVRETDVVAKLVPLLAKYHIFLHQTVTKHKRESLYTTSSGNTMWLTTVWVEGTWMDGDSNETLPAATFIGYGADTGDKGIYKAMTGSEKYMLMKTFLISTGDDPEADEKVDKTTAATTAARGPVRVEKGTAKVDRGAKSDTITGAQHKEIARLARKLEMDADTFGTLFTRITSVAVVEGETIRDALNRLTSEQAGQLIVALTAMDTLEAEPIEEVVDSPSTGVDENEATEAFVVS